MKKIGTLVAIGMVVLRSFATDAVADDQYFTGLAQALGKRVAVVSADPAKVTAADGVVTVAQGATLKFRVKFGSNGRTSFSLGGTCTPTCDKAELKLKEDGRWSFVGTVDATYDVTVTASEGPVTVSNVKVPKRGLYVALKVPSKDGQQ